MLRNARHNKILEIIEVQEVETQEELCQLLSEHGFSVTQATVSRDIKELHLFKVKGVNKRFRYASISENENGITDKMRALFKACVLSIRAVGNLILIRTLSGNGANAGIVVDRLEYREVVGCLSGDDTVLVICESADVTRPVCDRLNAIAKG